jgi:hypothetical protein
MSTAGSKGGGTTLDDIRGELEAADRTPSQRKHAFELLRHWLREQPDDEQARTLWARFQDEFGRGDADASLSRETHGEGFGALSAAERDSARR